MGGRLVNANVSTLNQSPSWQHLLTVLTVGHSKRRRSTSFFFFNCMPFISFAFVPAFSFSAFTLFNIHNLSFLSFSFPPPYLLSARLCGHPRRVLSPRHPLERGPLALTLKSQFLNDREHKNKREKYQHPATPWWLYRPAATVGLSCASSYSSFSTSASHSLFFFFYIFLSFRVLLLFNTPLKPPSLLFLFLFSVPFISFFFLFTFLLFFPLLSWLDPPFPIQAKLAYFLSWSRCLEGKQTQTLKLNPQVTEKEEEDLW